LIHESNNSSIGPILSSWVSDDKQEKTPNTSITIGNQKASIVSIDEAVRSNYTTIERHDLAKANFANAIKGTMWTITDLAVHEPNRNNGGYITGATENMASLISAVKGSSSVGMVLLPFLGDRYLEGNNSGGEARKVYGDVLSQVIINKNFKY
jgi:hypothetical protein